MIKRYVGSMAVAAALLSFMAVDAAAAGCASGRYRAGCAGPNGAVVVKKPVQPKVVCASGVYRAGCAGPNGAAVVRK